MEWQKRPKTKLVQKWLAQRSNEQLKIFSRGKQGQWGATGNLVNMDQDTLIPQGWYPLVITGVNAGNTLNSGTPYVRIEFKITDGDYKGRKLFSYLGAQVNGKYWELPTTRRFAELVNMPVPQTYDITEWLSDLSTNLIGQTLEGEVKHQQFKDTACVLMLNFRPRETTHDRQHGRSNRAL